MMNVVHIITNGIMMMAFFNLFACVICSVNPRYMMSSYPKAIREAAPIPVQKSEKRVYHYAMVVMLVVPLVFGAIGLWQIKTEGFWTLALSAYIEWLFVNFGDFILLDCILPRKYLKLMTVPGTEGNEWYKPKKWILKYAVPEHFIAWVFIMCPVLAAAQAGLVMLLKIIF